MNERPIVNQRNLLRLQKAKERSDIRHLEVHYNCVDDDIMDALLQLLTTTNNSEQRIWKRLP